MANMDLKKLLKDPSGYALSLPIDKLVEILQYSNDVYHNTSESVFSDEIYDTLIEVLTAREPQNKFLKQIGAPSISNNLRTLTNMLRRKT